MAQLRSGSGRTEGVAIWALVRHPLLCRVIRVTRSIARLRKVKLSAALGCNSLHVVFIWRRMVLRLRQACITRCLRSLTRTRPSLRRRLKFWSLPLPMRALHTMQHPHPALVSPERGTGLSGTHGSRPRRLARLTSTLDQRLATCSRDVHKRARHPSLYLSATIACTALLRWVSRVPFFVSCPNMAGGLPITVRVSSSEAVVPFFFALVVLRRASRRLGSVDEAKMEAYMRLFSAPPWHGHGCGAQDHAHRSLSVVMLTGRDESSRSYPDRVVHGAHLHLHSCVRICASCTGGWGDPTSHGAYHIPHQASSILMTRVRALAIAATPHVAPRGIHTYPHAPRFPRDRP